MTAEEYVKHYASGQGGFESVSVDVALKAIEYAKQEAKQQMMAKAVDAHVNYAWCSLCFGGFDWSKTGLNIGDKCKLIIIKED